MKIAVTDAKFERLQKRLVLHEIEGVEDVETCVLGRYEGVVHQVQPRRFRRSVVERIGRFQ